ncbi:MAG: hypothetical protein EBV45_13420 [Chloroflexi bacterium]|nr:hypothetical protein [Chloroflexota bacterium]
MRFALRHLNASVAVAFRDVESPWITPGFPHRGQRCEPAHTRLVAEKIASLRGLPLAEIARETTAAAEKFFRFPSIA